MKHTISRRSVVAMMIGLAGLSSTQAQQAGASPTAWKSLPVVKPEGELSDIGGYTVPDSTKAKWQQPTFTYNADLATKPKLAKVIVVIYNPRLKSQAGKTLVEFLSGSDPRKCSQMLAGASHTASGG